MTEKPILFCGEMVRAILEGRKTQTRRIVKKDIADCCEDGWPDPARDISIESDHGDFQLYRYCPYSADRLWVKETFAIFAAEPVYDDDDICIVYKATDESDLTRSLIRKWKPSIFMPRKYSRINLKVTNIRVERVQEITEEDAIAEGCTHTGLGLNISADEIETAKEQYQRLWKSINGENSWESNPWVWVVEFEREK